MSSETYFLPASITQRHFVAESPYLPEAALHHLALALRLDGGLDPAMLARAQVQLSQRHETLRTGFQAGEGGLCQAIRSEVLPDWRVEDLSREAAPEEALARRMREAFQCPFDLAHPPLLRARLFQLGEACHVLFLVMHAAVSDCASMRILGHELLALYEGRSLPPMPFQFADFAAWQRERLENAPELLEAWRARLADDPLPLSLPADRPRATVRGFRCDSLPIGLPADVWGPLQALAQRGQATPFMVLAAGFLLLLARTAGCQDLVLGVPVPGRVLPEVEGVVGPFGNTLPLRIQVEEAETVRGVLARVREAWLEALSGQDVPAALLLDALPLRRDPLAPRLFQTTFTLLDPEPPAAAPPGLVVSPQPFRGGHSRVELGLVLREVGGALEGSLDYDPDLFEPATVKAFRDRLTRLYRGMAAAPDLPAGCLPRPDGSESRDLAAMAATGPGREGLLHVLVERQAARNPEAVALEEGERKLTYGALDRGANHLARTLIQRGVRPGHVVAVIAGPCLELGVALLGVLKTGAAALPLDMDLPPAGWAAILSDVRPACLVGSRQGLRLLPEGTVPRVLLDGDPGMEDLEPIRGLQVAIAPDAVAMVLHQAGGSGRAVPVPHRRFVAFITGLPGFALNESTATLLALPLRLEGGALELWGALAHGGRCLLPAAREPLQAALARLAARGLDTLRLSSALFHQVALADPYLLRPIRQALLGPDPPNAILAGRIKALLPGLRLVHGFGDAQSALFVSARTYAEDARADPNWPSVGFPLPGVTLRVVDPFGGDVPPGLTGELLIGSLHPGEPPARTGLRARMGRRGLELSVAPPTGRIRNRGGTAGAAGQPPAPGPSNPTQALLLRIWEEVLGRPVASPRDNFFDLGGTSLQIVRMLARVESLLQWRPPMSLLFSEATVAGLENAFRRRLEEVGEEPLQCVQVGEAGLPWFFLHGDVFGAGIYCRLLARLLGEGCGFYAIHPHGTAGQPVPATVEAMATEHRRLIQGIRPQGPYLLGGFCNSAVVAFEVARQLEASGECVALLALVAPASLQERPGAPPPAEEPEDGALDLMKRLDRSLLRAAQAVQAYGPAPIRARTVILAPEGEREALKAALPRWRRVLEQPRVRWVPGGHLTFMTRHAEALAEALREEAGLARQRGCE